MLGRLGVRALDASSCGSRHGERGRGADKSKTGLTVTPKPKTLGWLRDSFWSTTRAEPMKLTGRNPRLGCWEAELSPQDGGEPTQQPRPLSTRSSVARSTRKQETAQADPAARVRGQANSLQKHPSLDTANTRPGPGLHMTNSPLAPGPAKPACPLPPLAGCYQRAGIRQGWGPLRGSQLPNKR